MGRSACPVGEGPPLGRTRLSGHRTLILTGLESLAYMYIFCPHAGGIIFR